MQEPAKLLDVCFRKVATTNAFVHEVLETVEKLRGIFVANNTVCLTFGAHIDPLRSLLTLRQWLAH